MVELKEKRKPKDDDRFKPVPNPNYKPPINQSQTNQAQASISEDNSLQKNTTTKNNIYQSSTSSSPPLKAHKPKVTSISKTNTSNTDISGAIPSESNTEQTTKSIPTSTKTEKSNITTIPITKQVEKPKVINGRTDTLKDINSSTKNSSTMAKPSTNTPRISPLYAMTPQVAAATLSRQSSTVNVPPLPSTPRPSTAPLMRSLENSTKEKLEERWTISSTRRIEKLPVRVSNPKLNERNHHLFSTKPLPTLPKHTEFRSSSGFGNLEYTTSYYQPSLTNQPSWISDQNYKWNQSQQNERAFELTQNK